MSRSAHYSRVKRARHKRDKSARHAPEWKSIVWTDAEGRRWERCGCGGPDCKSIPMAHGDKP